MSEAEAPPAAPGTREAVVEVAIAASQMVGAIVMLHNAVEGLRTASHTYEAGMLKPSTQPYRTWIASCVSRICKAARHSNA